MTEALLGLLQIFEPVFWLFAGVRHEPPRDALRVLGDINPERR